MLATIFHNNIKEPTSFAEVSSLDKGKNKFFKHYGTLAINIILLEYSNYNPIFFLTFIATSKLYKYNR